MLRRGTRKRTASARAGVRRTPVVSKGVSSRASVQSSMTVTRPEAIYTSGHDGAAIPTTATVSTTRMLMPTFSSNQDNSVHIPDMIPWQPRRAIDLQSTVDNTQFVSQTGNVTNNDYVQIPNRIESVHENLGINVTQSIKEKNIEREFIDLACLLNNSVNTGSDKQKLTWAQGEFILQPISQQSKITNIEKWTDAFIIFIYIYCAVHVNQGTVKIHAHNTPWGSKKPSSHKQDLDQISELWRLGRTPIKIGVLKNMLRAYPHAGVAKELYEGFLCGFRLKYSGPRISFISKNLQSANCHKVETLDKLDQEVKAVEEIPGTSTRGRVGSRKQPRRVQRFDIESETNRLINCSLAPNTIQAYQRALNALAKFRDSFDLDHSFPIPLNHITQFIAYMSCLDMAPSTVKCYISAISFYNKINNYEDMSQLFVVRKMIDGMARSKLKRPDSQEVSVWIVGSSLIRNAFVHARSRTGGVNLGLHRIGVKIWWQGYGGMGIKDLESTIKRLMKYEKAPKYLVLHIAGNDLGKTKLGFLRNEIKTTLEKVQSYLPNSSIVWSQILPRTNWRHSISQDSMMACRIRINSAIASFVLKNGGHYIKYPDILPNSTFLKEDGVHLTDLGNDIFLNNLQGALEMFICSGSYTYPDTFGTSMCIS
ncbi:unnamed protein product [Mytilus edulis]|uniref:Core-binding (CB) domain-containing protein n=1 Tax=Mytilus edulis TaxID=6550 RepID=A0A8S3QTV3_MYTED|nr:unnamed protein product [Mytilus edulis]